MLEDIRDDLLPKTSIPPPRGTDEASNSTRTMHRPPLVLYSLLAALGLALVVTSITAPFTIDEDNYLVTVASLRQGSFALADTAGLPRTNALLWFDPVFWERPEPKTPVVSTAPPLYGFIALPFSIFGWRGLQALNVLSLLVGTLLVFALARTFARRELTPWIAAWAFALGGFAIEYAQAVWPHMLATTTSLGAICLAAKSRRHRSLAMAALGGILAGLSAGIRYQNIVLALVVGAGLWLFSERRWAASAAYALGLALPLLGSAIINFCRIDTPNPISKGGNYIPEVHTLIGGPVLQELIDHLGAVWAMVIDYRHRPPMGTASAPWHWWPNVFGMFTYDGAVRKAWLQSSPWVAVALLFAATAWWKPRLSREQRNESKALGLVIVAVLGVFAVAGYSRYAGLCYNARYLFELTPLAAVLLAWATEELSLNRRVVLLGAGVGAALGGAALLLPTSAYLRDWLILTIPLGLAILSVIGWSVRRKSRLAGTLSAALICASLVWGLCIHLGDDLPASRSRRLSNQSHLGVVAALPETPTGLLTFGGYRDSLGPLLLDHEVVIADLSIDRGRMEHELVSLWMEQGRRVFVDQNALPPRLIGLLSREWSMRPLPNAALVELLQPVDAPPRGSPQLGH